MPNKGWRPTDETRAKLRAAWELRRSRLPGFWELVDKTLTCWLWKGSSSDNRYGQYQRDGVYHLAHRYAYEQVNGPIPEGMELDHLCRRPRCVRPDHLEAVTPKVNQRRGNGFSGINYRKTHCVHGHELSGSNVQVQQTGARAGRRRCLACHRARNRAYMRAYYRRGREDAA